MSRCLAKIIPYLNTTSTTRQYGNSHQVCRLGPRPSTSHDPPACYDPKRLNTRAFKIPPYIRPKVFRPLQQQEQLGPNASKCLCYQNPEYYAYHRYSYYDLKMAANAVRACIECDN